METIEANTKNKVLGILYKILVVTGIIALLYLAIQLADKYLNNKKTFPREK